MKKKDRFPIIIACILFVLILTGYLGYKYYKPTNLSSLNSVPFLQDLHLGWKTFTDNERGIIFKYPAKYQECSEFGNRLWDCIADKSAQIYIDVYGNMYQNESTIDGVINAYFENGIAGNQSLIKSVKIGNINGLSYTLRASYHTQDWVYVVENQNTNKIFIIDVLFSEVPGDNVNKQDSEIVNQILSTFRFTQ